GCCATRRLGAGGGVADDGETRRRDHRPLDFLPQLMAGDFQDELDGDERILILCQGLLGRLLRVGFISPGRRSREPKVEKTQQANAACKLKTCNWQLAIGNVLSLSADVANHLPFSETGLALSGVFAGQTGSSSTNRV